MALLITEDCPKNPKELIALLGDFLSDGMCYNEEESVKLCAIISKSLIDRLLINVENRDTIIAAKLSEPVTINDLVQVGHNGVVREDEFFDPLLAGERTDGNYNKNEDRAKWKEKKDAKFDEK
jgi:hypothetical protein